ncbi:hypothetical protein BC938DRAFT_481846 [Jimgerdemannia flammicorona]|uniref:Uncharacterized protein n=1 Tax=Jimgerdemannia flammicorona TaxID=994334 RepID=A0A433QF66_9FUNG|nr:hypothetical protein BC938DRAFT_481846 [Jimgerdemannia flammicorona]
MSVLTHHDIVLFESIATKDAAFDLDLYSLLAIVILTAANQPEYVTAVVERRLRALGESVSSKALFLTRVREALLKASLLCGFPRVGQLENVIDFVCDLVRGIKWLTPSYSDSSTGNQRTALCDGTRRP